MNYVIILLVALVTLLVTRVIFTLIYNSQKEADNVFERVLLSFAVLLLFLGIWGVTISLYITSIQVSDTLVWYVIFLLFGIPAIIWCYFRWDLKWKAKPKLEDKTVSALKKTIVFAIVMMFAFYHGYEQMDAIFNDVNVDSTLAIYNVTLIAGIIALDRVLNQVTFVYKEWKEKQKEQKSK